MVNIEEPALAPTATLAVDVVVFTLRPEPVERGWQVLLVPRTDHWLAGRLALPGILVNDDETFDAAARRALQVKAGLDARDWYLEQLATFGHPARDSRGRVASVAHIALVRSDYVHFESIAGGLAPHWCPVSAIPWDEVAFDHTEILREAPAA